VLTLITGVPGAGKTLYALNLVKARAEKEGRTVYQSGIADCTLSWETLDDPAAWEKVPDGSLVLIDEAQRAFRPRGVGSVVPPHVAALETHRHRGLDIVLTTQHPNLVDANVRRLVGQHFHVVRRFGAQRAVIYEWPSAHEIGKGSLDDALRHEFRYPVGAFAWYKSAELHTHKRHVPFRVIFLFLAPLIIGGLCWAAYESLRGYWDASRKSEGPELLVTAPGKGSPGAAAAPGGTVRGAAPGGGTVGEYLAAYKPRVEGLSYTAPVYDEITKPTRAPVPVACVSSGDRCECYSQDATVLAVDRGFCRMAVERGVFVNFAVAGSKQGEVVPTGPASLRSGSTARAAPTAVPATALVPIAR